MERGPEVAAHSVADAGAGVFAAHRVGGATLEPLYQR